MHEAVKQALGIEKARRAKKLAYNRQYYQRNKMRWPCKKEEYWLYRENGICVKCRVKEVSNKGFSELLARLKTVKPALNWRR